MPYVPPVVGYFGRLTGSGVLRMYGVCCAQPADYRTDDFVYLLADNFLDSGGDGCCEACRQILTTDPKQLVHVPWGTTPERIPTIRQSS